MRALGPVLARSIEPLSSVSQVRALSDGRVIVNDNTGRRVLLFDSTLQRVTVIADTTSATANAYGPRVGGLIAYRGDSTLFAEPVSLLMLLIDGNGKIVRTMATPEPNEIAGMIGGPFGTPGFDAEGRLVHRALMRPTPRTSAEPPQPAESSLIVRFNLANRTVDTVVKWGIPQIREVVTRTPLPNGRTSIRYDQVVNPIPWTDDWALLADGTIAVVRGRDYRVDFIDANDKVTSTPKLGFEWQRLSDEDKVAILDSTRTEMEKLRSAQITASTPSPTRPPLQFVTIDEMPDYRPPFRQGAARGDADGNLWIRTTKMTNGGAVYDVINRQGALIDRIQVPSGRVIAGFGPGGVVYMGVVDGNITRMERARVALRP